MDKYLLLILFNIPFIIFGLIEAGEKHHKKLISGLGLVIRVLFWLFVLICLIWFRAIYDFLASEQLTDSPPLSIMDVALVTAVIFCFSLSIKLYSKIEELEKQLTLFHQKMSVNESAKRRDQQK